MSELPFIHHGGRFQVTGSCHELRLHDGSGLLIDCGLTQGTDQQPPKIDFPVDHLRALLPDPRTDVIFCGYQAIGTTGHDIQHYGSQGGHVYLDGEKVNIQAHIHTISGYSAHADQRNLYNFVRRMRHKPQHIRLVHGENHSRKELAEQLTGLGIEVD